MEYKLKLVKMHLRTLEVGTPPHQQPWLALQTLAADGNGKNHQGEWIVLTPPEAQGLIEELQAALDHMAGKAPQNDPSPRH